MDGSRDRLARFNVEGYRDQVACLAVPRHRGEAMTRINCMQLAALLSHSVEGGCSHRLPS
eukprot:2868475-Pyramimonas_sp.AAC.1